MSSRIIQVAYYPIRTLSFIGGLIIICSIFESIPIFLESAIYSRFPILVEYIVFEYAVKAIVHAFVVAVAIPAFVLAIYTMSAAPAQDNILILMFSFAWAASALITDWLYSEQLTKIILVFLAASYPAIMLIKNANKQSGLI